MTKPTRLAKITRSAPALEERFADFLNAVKRKTFRLPGFSATKMTAGEQHAANSDKQRPHVAIVTSLDGRTERRFTPNARLANMFMTERMQSLAAESNLKEACCRQATDDEIMIETIADAMANDPRIYLRLGDENEPHVVRFTGKGGLAHLRVAANFQDAFESMQCLIVDHPDFEEARIFPR